MAQSNAQNQKSSTPEASDEAIVMCSDEKINWKVDTPALLAELCNAISRDGGILKIPLNIFQGLLAQVALRAIELDDKEMNKLMIRLALYENPHSKETLGYLNT